MARKSKRLAGLVVASMLAMATVGGTMAYLTDEKSAVNVMTMGNVSIEQIEQEYGDDGLQPFTQDKPLMPYVGELGWASSDDPAWRQFAMENVVDKYVTVENTGKTDAYVRTFVALEMGDFTYEEFSKQIGISVNAANGSEFQFDGAWVWTDDFVAEIDGRNYNVMVAEHQNPLAAGEVTIPSLLQVYLSKDATNDDIEKLDGNGNGKYDILVFSQAVQSSGFPNAETALDTAFYDASENAHPWASTEIATVSTSEDFEDALSSDKQNIIVSLDGDVTYDVAAWANDAMGGASTENITIDGNGHTITFNQTNTDWNNIVTSNGATLTIINAHVTNAGHNNGPWNRHDLNFACDVKMNNVTSDKAMAFKAGAELVNVTISDANTSDTYAIWIQPNGQTVTLDGCTIDMLACTDGRGIKIDNQYVDADDEKGVTLKVSNTTFKTEEKAAILVKSLAGANIVLNDIDFSGVLADSTNAVWVDEATATYADLVSVIGGSKIVEP